ncbi:hypothetical protein GCM10027440_26280 [Nocardiopsis coralliicola]
MFQALSDATRRDILRRCAEEAVPVSRLAQAYPMSFAAVQKHVAALERAGLVVKEQHGRERRVRTVPAGLDGARRALDLAAGSWRGRADRMAQLLEEDGPAGPASGTGGTR